MPCAASFHIPLEESMGRNEPSALPQQRLFQRFNVFKMFCQVASECPKRFNAFYNLHMQNSSFKSMKNKACGIFLSVNDDFLTGIGLRHD